MAGNVVLILVLCAITYVGGNTTPPPVDNNLPEENPTSNNQNMHMVCGPASSNELVTEVGQSYQKAISWLLSQRKDNWGWPLKSTATAILSLQLTSNGSWYSIDTDDLTAQLSIKQLEIELLAELSRAKVVEKDSRRQIRTLPDMSPGMFAYYIMALNSTCHDVTDFYKNDLVEILMGNMNRFPQPNFNNYFQYGLALLALCQSGASIRTRYIREILDGQSEDGSYRYGTDVVSIALMAMTCVREEVPDGYRKRYEQKVQRSIDYILANQNTDGSFGNHISTALAIQALRSAGVESSNWNCHTAVRTGVLAVQEDEGNFGSQGGTIQILPLLFNENFASVKHVRPHCDIAQDEEINKSAFPDVNITLRIENSVNSSAEPLELFVVVPENSTLYESMKLATKQYPDTFRFEARLGQWGHFMSHINDIYNDGDRHHYWTILIGQDRVSAATGSDGIIIKDGGLYIWYFKSFA